MSQATFFVQECPTCGRRLQVRVKFLGKLVMCRHCRGRFEACDPEGSPLASDDSGERLLERVNELLASTEEQKRRAR